MRRKQMTAKARRETRIVKGLYKITRRVLDNAPKRIVWHTSGMTRGLMFPTNPQRRRCIVDENRAERWPGESWWKDEMTPEILAELDRRLEAVNNGTARTIPWHEIRAKWRPAKGFKARNARRSVGGGA